MVSELQEALNLYLFPFVIAVPIAIVLYLLVTRREEPPARPPARPGSPGQPAGLQGFTPAGASRSGLSPAGQPAPGAPGGPGTPGTIPGHPGLPPEDLLAPPATQGPAGSALLLVDDSAVARAKLRKLFESAGYPVDVAKDGLEALELLAKKRYALMVTDLEMPQMDGIELIAAVHGSLETEDLPIIAITGHDDLQAKVHECEGLFGIFRKPWNDRDLLRRVQALVRLQEPAPAKAPV